MKKFEVYRSEDNKIEWSNGYLSTKNMYGEDRALVPMSLSEGLNALSIHEDRRSACIQADRLAHPFYYSARTRFQGRVIIPQPFKYVKSSWDEYAMSFGFEVSL